MYLKDIAQIVELHFNNHVRIGCLQKPEQLHAAILPSILFDLSERQQKAPASITSFRRITPSDQNEDVLKVQSEVASKLLENLIEVHYGPLRG